MNKRDGPPLGIFLKSRPQGRDPYFKNGFVGTPDPSSWRPTDRRFRMDLSLRFGMFETQWFCRNTDQIAWEGPKIIGSIGSRCHGYCPANEGCPALLAALPPPPRTSTRLPG